MRAALVGALLLAGCTVEKPTGFGVNVRVLSSALSSAQRGQIVGGRLTVVGDAQSPFVAPVIANVGGAIGAGELRFRYIPAVHSGRLTLQFDALDGNQSVVVSGGSEPFDVVDGKAVDVEIPLGATAPDLGMPVDAGDDDGATDAAPTFDLRQIACGQILECINKCTSAKCTDVCVSYGTDAAKALANTFFDCYLTACMMPIPDAGAPPCNSPTSRSAECNDCMIEIQTGTSSTGQTTQPCMPKANSPYCGKCVDVLLNCANH